MSSNSAPLETEAALFVCTHDPVSFIARIAALHDIAQYKLVAQPSAHIHDVYFDTPARILTERGYGLRVRRMNERWLLTLKGEASRTEAGVQRREREVSWSRAGLSAILSDLRALGLQIASEGFHDDDADPMETMRALGFDAIQNRETHRQIRHVVAPAHDDTLAEFALDTCVYHFASGDARCHEIEIEQKSSSGEAILKNVRDDLLANHSRELRGWPHSKLITGFGLEQLLRQHHREQVLDANGDLRMECCDELESILRTLDVD